MNPLSCRIRIDELNATLTAPAATRRDLETRLAGMTTEVLDRAAVAALLDDFD